MVSLSQPECDEDLGVGECTLLARLIRSDQQSVRELPPPLPTTALPLCLSQASCPVTTAVLLQIPAVRDIAARGLGEVLFSAIAPGTRLKPHCGGTNARLTCHLGLVVPPPQPPPPGATGVRR